MLLRPYSLPAGGVFSYGQGRMIGKRFQNKYPQKMKNPLPRPRKIGGCGIGPKRDGANFAGGRSRPSLDRRKEGKRRSRPLPRPGKLAGYGIGPKRDGENFAGGRSRPSLDGRKEGKRRSRPLPRPGKLAGYGMYLKRVGDLEGVAEG